MRIIAGTARGRRLSSPTITTRAGRGRAPIRPTSDRTREALFSILADRVKNAVLLDLFAGTGALGLEAMSRGARKAVFVDTSEEAVRLIRHNSELCGLSEGCSVIRRDLTKGLSFLKKGTSDPTFSLIFADPPYGKGLAEQVLKELVLHELVTDGGTVIIEESADWQSPAVLAPLWCADHRRYGDTGLWFFCWGRQETSGI